MVNHLKLNSNLIPSNPKEQIDFIIKCFDFSDNTCGKIEFILDHKAMWLAIYREKNTFTWLSDKNIDQCKWALQYIENKDKNKIFIKYSPSSDNDIYTSIIVNYDLWVAHEDTKFRFLTQIKQSWNKRKQIASLKEKKSKQCSFIISVDSKNTLKNMADQQGVTQNALLEKLINKEAKARLLI